MPKRHIVEQGDNIPNIAFRYGFFPETIWNDSANAELKALRKIPDVLLPGDVVSVPDLRQKDAPAPTGSRTVFRRRGVPAKTRFQLFEGELPLANVGYTLTVGPVVRTGTTDGQGFLEQFIPPDAETGELKIEPNGPVYPLTFGRMDPISELIGVQKRLNNLGFTCGEPGGEMNEETRVALIEFQKRVQLPATGELDDATRSRIEQLHDKKSSFPPVAPPAQESR